MGAPALSNGVGVGQLQTDGEMRRSDMHVDRAFWGRGFGSPARSGQQQETNRQVKMPELFPARGIREGHKFG